MQIPRDIAEEFALQRRNALNEQQQHRDEAYAKDPEIKRIENQCLALAFELGKPGKKLEDFERQKVQAQKHIDLLQERKFGRLAAVGLPSDYLIAKFACPICEDTGFYGYPTKRMCKCLEQRLLESRFASSNIDINQTFEKFDFTVYKDSAQRAKMSTVYDFALAYAESLPNATPANIMLMGKTGIGKTFTLNCIAYRALEKNLSVIKITAYNLINATLRAISAHEPTPNFINCDLLFLDDLGSEPLIPNITIETLFSIINERETLNRPTIIATNLSLVDLGEKYDERVFSRLIAPRFTQTFTLLGGDVRLGN